MAMTPVGGGGQRDRIGPGWDRQAAWLRLEAAIGKFHLAPLRIRKYSASPG